MISCHESVARSSCPSSRSQGVFVVIGEEFQIRAFSHWFREKQEAFSLERPIGQTKKVVKGVGLARLSCFAKNPSERRRSGRFLINEVIHDQLNFPRQVDSMFARCDLNMGLNSVTVYGGALGDHGNSFRMPGRVFETDGSLIASPPESSLRRRDRPGWSPRSILLFP